MPSTAAPILTITIPTYKRPARLAMLLATLRPQVDERVEVIVIDNANDKETELVVSASGVAGISYVANVVNIGMAGNLLRCFEYGQGQLLWMVGDDDEPEPNAVDRIVETCLARSDVVQWNFSTFFKRNSSFETIGMRQFLAQLDSLPNLIFISANVYQRVRILKYLADGYRMATSLCPQTAVALAAVADHVPFSFRHEVICQRPTPERSENWSWVHAAETMPLICDMPALSQSESRRLRRLFFRDCKIHNFYFACLVMNPKYHVQAAVRYRRYRERWFDRAPLREIAKSFVYRLLLRMPNVTKKSAEILAKSIGKSSLLDRYREDVIRHARE